MPAATGFEQFFLRYAKLPVGERGVEAFARRRQETQGLEVVGPPLAIGGSELAAAERVTRRLVRLAPYRESGYRLLLRTLDTRGERAEALLVYEQLRAVLRDEIGATPSPASQALHRERLGEAS